MHRDLKEHGLSENSRLFHMANMWEGRAEIKKGLECQATGFGFYERILCKKET